MKRRMVLLGRGGTTVIVIGLALFLVSLIPPIQIESSSYGSANFGYSSDTWSTLNGWVLTGLQTLRATVTANGTLSLYILEVNSETIYDWINQTYSGTIGFLNVWNVKYFDQFLNLNPGLIAWRGEIHNGTIGCEYASTKIVNVTLAVSNHSPDVVSVPYYTSSIFRSLAPVSKVRTIAELAIPAGVTFTLPWLSHLTRAQKKK